MNGRNKLSVIMPVYNAEGSLRESIESILIQTFSDFKFIIIDDGSTDGSSGIIREYEKKDKRIEVIKNNQNLGLIDSLNKGVKRSSTEYIARTDADDIAMKTRLEKQMGFIEKSPDIGLIGVSYYSVNEKGKIVEFYKLPEDDIQIRWCMLFQNALIHSGVVFRKEIFDLCNGYSKMMIHAEDYDLWSRMLKFTQAANLSEPLMKIQRGSNKISSVYQKEQMNVASRISFKNINDLKPNQVEFSLIDINALRKLYYPSSVVECPGNCDFIINSYIDIANVFIKKYGKDKRIKKHIAYTISTMLYKCPDHFLNKKELYLQAAKFDFLQTVKAIIKNLLRYCGVAVGR